MSFHIKNVGCKGNNFFYSTRLYKNNLFQTFKFIYKQPFFSSFTAILKLFIIIYLVQYQPHIQYHALLFYFRK
jgi:hypothetical protein